MIETADNMDKITTAVPQAYGPGKPMHGGKLVSGLEFLQAIVADSTASSQFNSLIGIRLIEAENDRVLYRVTPETRHMNALGIAHGGLAATLIDSATGAAVLSVQPAGGRSTTLELKVNFIRPLTAATGPVECEGKVVHVGRRVATAEGRVIDAKGKLIAHGSATIMVFQAEDG